ncbi:MAG: hypothetical protein AAF657_15355 [Acidobacteriota bacterium]
MIHNDEELRRAYLSHTRDRLPEDSPGPEDLWQLATGELSASEARGWIDHISRCPACAEDFRLTRQMVAEMSDEADLTVDSSAEEPTDITEVSGRSVVAFPQRSDGSRWWRNVAAAAAVLMVAGGIGWRLAQPDDVTFRQGGETLVQSLLADDRIAPRAEANLRWSGPEGAVYDLIVTTEALEIIYQAEGLATTELQLPKERLEGLPAGTVLRWHVEAVLPDGTRLPSDTFDLSLADE